MKQFILIFACIASGSVLAQSATSVDSIIARYHNGDQILAKTDFGPKVAAASASPAEVFAMIDQLSNDHQNSHCQLSTLRPDSKSIEITVRSQNSIGLLRADSSLKSESRIGIMDTTKAYGFIENAPFAILDQKVRKSLGSEYHAVQVRLISRGSNSARSVHAGTTYQVLKVYYGETPHGTVLLAADLKTYDADPFLFLSASFRLNPQASGTCAVYSTASSNLY